MKSSTTHPQSRQATEEHPTSILAENPLQPSVLKTRASVRPDNFPSLLTQQPYWLPADQRKIPVLPQTDIHIQGDRLCQCQCWDNIRPLIERNIHPYAVYLHNQQEPYITLDVDHGRDTETGEPAEWLQPLFRQLGIHWNATIDRGESSRYPYIELSSSGTGYHVLFKGTTDFGKRSWFTTDNRGKDAPKLELIAHNNLITYTGNTLNCSGQLALPIELLLQYLTETYPDQHPPEPVQAKKNNVMTPEWRRREDKELTADQIADMLDRLNPDCDHDEWKQIGMAIHDWNSGQIGKDLWTQWSQGGEKYDTKAQQAINAAWKGFRSGRGIGVGTLVKMAMDNGFVFPKRNYNKTHHDSHVTDQKGGSAANTTLASNISDISDETDTKRQIANQINDLVQHYNQRFIHVVTGSKNAIMVKRKNKHYPKQEEWTPMSIKEFKDMLSHEEPLIIGFKKNRSEQQEPIFKQPAEIWLKHPNASYSSEGVTFWPQKTQWHNGRLNLFCGFAVDPIECPANDPDVQLWKNHLVNIVCQNDSNTARYVLNWLAHLFQFPHIKPKTGLILKGEQGTGKGTLITPILDILGVHGVHLFRPGSVSGRFNSILENKLLIFADEAVYNNRKDSSLLKGLISEKVMETERKGLEMLSEQNFSRLAMAADDDHVIKVSGSERRYLMLKMSNKYIQNSEYFARFQQANANGLPGKLLYRLLKIDLTGFIPMDVPKTSWLTEDKLNDLKPEQQFLFEMLMNGGFSSGWDARIDSKELQGKFREWLETNRIKFPGSIPIKLGNVMKKIGAKSAKASEDCSSNTYYELQDLEPTRKNFELNILNGSTVNWP